MRCGDIGHSPLRNGRPTDFSRFIVYLHKLLRNGYELDRIGYLDLGEPLEMKVADTTWEGGYLLEAVNRPPIMIYPYILHDAAIVYHSVAASAWINCAERVLIYSL